MLKGQLVCNHKTCFIFHFLSNDLRSFRRQDRFVKSSAAEIVDDWNTALSLRLGDISNMIRLLTAAHDSWRVLWKKDHIVMETDDYDFNDAVQVLYKHGYTDKNYILEVEYERKWGML